MWEANTQDPLQPPVGGVLGADRGLAHGEGGSASSRHCTVVGASLCNRPLDKSSLGGGPEAAAYP